MDIDFKKLELEDQETFDRYLNFYQPIAGELTFSNLHMWDCTYNAYFTEYEGFLCVVCGYDGDRFSFMPIDSIGIDVVPRLAKTMDMLWAHFESHPNNLTFRRTTKAESDLLVEAAKMLGYKAVSEYDRDNSDYVYRYEEISGLQGKKYHAKRNHIQNLINNENPEYLKLSTDLIPDCVKILEDWHADKINDSEMQCEKQSSMTLLENFEKYGRCKGAVIKVNGVAKAYTIGQMLNQTTLVVHAERADPSIRGLYPYVNQQFLLNEWPGIIYVNREQDCGSEGLRKAKLSYHPDHFIEKYVVAIDYGGEIL